MDWTLAIDRNKNALAAIIMPLGAMLRAGIGSTGQIARELRRAVLRLLAPAEAAVRRLIVIAARGMKAPLPAADWYPYVPWPGRRAKPKREISRLAFPLFDRPKRFLPQPQAPLGIPRIRSLGGDPDLVPQTAQSAPPPPRETAVDARRLWMRFDALQNALADLPGEARRLARLKARRQALKKPVSKSPLRPGHPPGFRQKRSRPIDDILAECQALAHEALADTS